MKICTCESSADRAKQIKTTAKVNEDPTEKLIRELKEENEKLMEMLKKAQAGEAVKMSADDDDDDDDSQKEGMSEEGNNLFYLFGLLGSCFGGQ